MGGCVYVKRCFFPCSRIGMFIWESLGELEQILNSYKCYNRWLNVCVFLSVLRNGTCWYKINTSNKTTKNKKHGTFRKTNNFTPEALRKVRIQKPWLTYHWESLGFFPAYITLLLKTGWHSGTGRSQGDLKSWNRWKLVFCWAWYKSMGPPHEVLVARGF